MARNLLSVGGKTPQKKAVGLSLSEDGQINLNNPKTNYVLGSIVEPYSVGYQGIVAVLGVECFASLSANLSIKGVISQTYGSNVLRVGSKYLIGGNKHLLRYNSNMELLDEVKLAGPTTPNATSIRRLMEVGNSICATTVTPSSFTLETYEKDSLVLENTITIPAGGNRAGDSRDKYWESDKSHVYLLGDRVIYKYNANLELVKSSAPIPEIGVETILGIIGNTLIISKYVASIVTEIVLYNTTTLEQVGVTVDLQGLSFLSGFVDGNNFIGVGPDYLTKIDLTDINNVTVTSLPSDLDASYSTRVIEYSNGLLSIITLPKDQGGPSKATGDTLTLLEYDPDLGAKRVYQITNIASGLIYKTHIDELERVWIISREGDAANIKLLSSELTLKGYRVIGG